MADVIPNCIEVPGILPDCSDEIADFAVRLFCESLADAENILISPTSVMIAISMCANGAKGETLTGLEEMFGMKLGTLNYAMTEYMGSLPQGDKYKLSLANSIWFTNDERFTVERDFLQTNADYYGADAYKTPFDGTTKDDVNRWVKKKTDGMVEDILDEVPDNAVMYLVNALAFEAEWMKGYDELHVSDGVFTDVDGRTQSASFMYDSGYGYFSDGDAEGFIKYYSGKKYAFAAILPREGVSVREYADGLDGEKLLSLLTETKQEAVTTAIPKFESEYSTDMVEVLKTMGVVLAFDPDRADLTGLGTSTGGNIFIDRVLHKTHVSVGERGTRAGAATVIETLDKSDVPLEEKEIILNRPFIYMLIDCEHNIPFFMGCVDSLGK